MCLLGYLIKLILGRIDHSAVYRIPTILHLYIKLRAHGSQFLPYFYSLLTVAATEASTDFLRESLADLFLAICLDFLLTASF